MGDFKALCFGVVCPVFVYCLQKMKKKGGRGGKDLARLLRWEPSELKKRKDFLFFAAGGGGSVPSPRMWGSPAAKGYFAFFEGGGKKKRGKNGRK